ncbi:hypothetical protein [Wolbachia endosymbiont of Drosophila bicornuta]|uniref:hypothetical protein n=1 Tax=Wolbachia endosymbiont of Drosophila bicornuta TaxID=375918 RepID=UPI0037F73DB7
MAFRIEEPAQDGEIFNLQHCTGRHDKGAGEWCQGSFSFHPMRCQKFVMQEIP